MIHPLIGTLAVVVLACGATAATVVGLVRLRRPDSPEERQRARAVSRLVGFGVTLVGFYAVGTAGAILAAVPGDGVGPIARMLIWLLFSFAGSLFAVSTSLLAFRWAVDETSEVAGKVGTAVLRTTLLAVGLVAGTLAMAWAAAAGHPVVVGVLPVVAVTVVVAAIPRLVVSDDDIVPLSAAPNDVVERAIERTGYDRDRVRIITDPNEDQWRPFKVGFDPFARVFVPESAFDAFDEDALEATLVVLTQRSLFRLYRVLTAGLWVGGAFVILMGVTSETGVLVLGLTLLVALPLMIWGGFRLVYRNDARAADQVGAERVATAHLRLREEWGGGEPSRGTRYVQMTPSVDQRVERLRGTAPGPNAGGAGPRDGAAGVGRNARGSAGTQPRGDQGARHRGGVPQDGKQSPPSGDGSGRSPNGPGRQERSGGHSDDGSQW